MASLRPPTPILIGILGQFAFSADFCYFSGFLRFSDFSFFFGFSGSGGVWRGRGRSLHAWGTFLEPADQCIKKSKIDNLGGVFFSCYVESKNRAIRSFKPINRGWHTHQ